jgi:hypothetical protein
VHVCDIVWGGTALRYKESRVKIYTIGVRVQDSYSYIAIIVLFGGRILFISECEILVCRESDRWRRGDYLLGEWRGGGIYISRVSLTR